jgi:hypothetical protein
MQCSDMVARVPRDGCQCEACSFARRVLG